MKSHLVNYAKWLVWQYYQTEGNTKLVIYLSWAPIIPSDKSKEALLVSQAWFDMIVPDYYGYGRSSGVFSTQYCVQTIYDTIQVFQQQWTMISVYSPDEIILSGYDEIVVVWNSYGGWIAAIMPKIEPIIKEIILLYPALDRLDRNEHGYPESTDEDFLREQLLWYKHLYRFVDWVDTYDAMLNIDKFDSLQDMSHLHDTKVFVWHGSADEVIWCGRSKQFIDNLRQMNPNGQYHYAEYYGLGHGGICKEAILRWWLYWRKHHTLQ